MSWLILFKIFSTYYGLTGRKDFEFRQRENRYKKARSVLRKHIIDLRKRSGLIKKRK